MLRVRERDHLLQPLLVAAGQHAQAAAEIVVQHQRPAAEHLLGQELREHAVRAIVRRRRRCARSRSVAVEHERRRRAGEIQLGELCGPRRKPARQLASAASNRRRPLYRRRRPAIDSFGGIRRHAAAPARRSASRIAGGSCELVGQAGQVLQLAHRLFRLLHAFGRRVDLTAQEVRVLPVDRHLGERLDLALDAIELDRHELRRSSWRARSCRAAARPSATLSCSELDDALVAAGLRGREILSELLRGAGEISSLRIVSQEAVERGLRQQQPEEQPQQPVERRACGSPPPIRSSLAGGAAHADGDGAHLDAARVQPLEPRARVGGQALRACDTSDGAAGAGGRRPAAPGARRGPWRRWRRGTAESTTRPAR